MSLAYFSDKFKKIGWQIQKNLSLASAITLCSGVKPPALAITRITRFCVICLYAPRHPNLLRSLSAALHKVVMMMCDKVEDKVVDKVVDKMVNKKSDKEVDKQFPGRAENSKDYFLHP